MGLNPVIAITLGYLALMAATAKGASAQLAIAIMIVVYILLASTIVDVVYSLLALLDWADIRVFVYISISLFIAGLLRETGALNRMASSLASAGCRFASLSVPALIGLLPMPGGALVSAMAVKGLYEEAGLKPYWMVYLNYWFRHIWVPMWPLFQSILITSAVIGIDPLTVVGYTWPAGVAAIPAGVLVAAPMLRKMKCRSRGRLDVRGLGESLWPFIAIVLLALVTPLGLLGALIAVLALVIAYYRPSASQLLAALRFALNPRIHVVLFEALFFKELLLSTHAPEALIEALSWLPTPILLYIVPFILGLGAGGENFFAATAMPLLSPVIAVNGGVNADHLLVAYLGGYLGVMASPVHLCFALTVDYFRANAAKAMALTLAAIAVTTVFTSLWVLWA